MKKLAIIGSGDFGLQAAEIAVAQNSYSVVGFYDDYSVGEKHGLPILGTSASLSVDFANNVFDCIFWAIGYKHFKEKERLICLHSAIPLATLVSPDAYIDPLATVAEGVLIWGGAYIGPRCYIGKNSVIHVHVSLPHDNIIGENAYISPAAAFGGFSSIGRRVFIGINATICDNLSIVDDCLVGAGSVVLKTIEDAGVYVGNPAKKIKNL